MQPVRSRAPRPGSPNRQWTLAKVLACCGLFLALGAACAPSPATAPAPADPAPSPDEMAEAAPEPAPGLPDVPLESGDPSRGEALFTSAGCLACHAVRGSGGGVGPDLAGVPERAEVRAAEQGLETAELYLIESIVDPPAYVVEGYSPVMPDWQQMNLDEQDLADLVAFLLTLE